MFTIQRLTVGLLLLSVTSCATKKDVVHKSKDLAKLQRKEVHTRGQAEQNRINQLIIAARNEAKQKARAKYALPDKVDEDSLYAEILRLNHMRNIEGVEFLVEEFIQKYPHSVHADNALFVAGQLLLSLGFAPESIKYFEKILQEYPLSHKHSAAIFHKAMAYRRLKLFNYAEKALNEVQRIYPGSPESYRVELELKLLKTEQAASL